MEIKFNKITMKDGAINIEEDKDLSKMLTESMGDKINIKENKFCKMLEETVSNHAEFTKTKRERAMELDSHYYSTPDSNKFFTADLEQMKDIITDELKNEKILYRLSQGNKFGTFRRYKTQQPMLVKAYKTRRGAEQNTFWRNH